MEINCCKCGQSITDSKLVKTDEFKEYGSKVKNYCPDCFIIEVKHGFGNYNIGHCTVCDSPLVLQHDDEETVSLAQDDYTVHFVCEKLKAAIDREDENEVEHLEQDEHDWLILYTIQPNPNEPDFG